MGKCAQASKFVAALVGVVSACGILAIILASANPAAAREAVAFSPEYPFGTIVISQHERKLYFSEGNGRAIRYPIAVGMAGRAWLGQTYVEGKYLQPDWTPPAVVLHDHPNLSFTRGGSPHNPMGAAAITLQRHQVAIHGTTMSMRRSIGSAASYGCIRMYNEDVVDLYQRVNVGAPVISIP
jgi:lipoprotein-anchoring transpeptidase ErfK/SrfK